MSHSSRFRLNQPHVVYESFADEVVLINLASGNYYSADQTGKTVIQMLADSRSPGEIVSALAARHDEQPGEIEKHIQPFIDALEAEGLIVPVLSNDSPAAPVSMPAQGISVAADVFIPPRLQRFSDMQDLLLLDPVHQVDESGWPVPKTESPRLDE